MNIKFFKMIAAAAFANPFSNERVEVDRQIVGASEDVSWEGMLEPLLAAVDENLSELEKTGPAMEGRDKDPNRKEIGITVLFSVFHQYMEQFDKLISDQISAGDESIEAPFVLECIHKLQAHGFAYESSCRYSAMFYQIRRAFHFISKGLIGESNCMKQLRKQLWDNIFTNSMAWYEQNLWNRMEDFSTLLLGETGSGKGAAAAAIGRSGYIPFYPNKMRFAESFTRAFVSINLSQYPETLIESELFGHRKGAFTGAMEKHEGIFARCSPFGAIFLDEIGDVSIPIQIKLLQVLQERTFSPVGSHETQRFKGRVIAATNKSIDELRREGKFRDDFYYRLCSDLITVPPLHQRIQETTRELDTLATHILQRICCDTDAELKTSVLTTLKKDLTRGYRWPGNVRELEQAIRRILLTGRYEGDSSVIPTTDSTLSEAIEHGNLTAKELIERYCRELYNVYGNYGEVARRTGLDWRTVKKNIGA